MKPFDEWVMASPAAPTGKTWQHWEDEGHGVVTAEGFMVECCRCERHFAASDFVDPDEFDPDACGTFYCGGNEWCCP